MAQTSLSNIAPESYVSSLDNSDKQKNDLSFNDNSDKQINGLSFNDKLYDKLNDIIDILMDIKRELRKG